MQPGEILVTPFTDVGWTPYFSRAAGLATEVGSVLSHGAVVAREYGLPAVAGLPGVTRRFKTGDMLKVDGNTGELRHLRDSESVAAGSVTVSGVVDQATANPSSP